MLKRLILVTVLTVGLGVGIYDSIPRQPEYYTVVTVQYGDTVEDLVHKHNAQVDSADYDIREAVAQAIKMSKKKGGAQSRSLKVGDELWVPIYH